MPLFAMLSMFGVLPIIPWVYAPTFQVPMSSPQMTTMLGLAAACWASPAAHSDNPSARAPRIRPDLMISTSCFRSLVEREDFVPVLLHVHDNPALRDGFVPGLVEPPDLRRPVVRPLALGVGVVDDAAEADAFPCRRPLEHLLVAVGVAEREDGAPADVVVDPLGLAGTVVDEEDLRLAHQHRTARAQLVLRGDRAADDLLGGDPVNAVGEDAHELRAAARHDERLVAARSHV